MKRQSALAAAAMGLGLCAWIQLGWGMRLSAALGGVVIGGGIYALVMWALHVPEAAFVVRGINRRLSRG